MQKYIGNVIVSNLNYRIDKCFNKCKSLEEIGNDLPVLIIGLENAKKLIKDFNILKREYNGKKVWWTLSKTEKRVEYDKNIADFCEFCINNILDEVRYRNINVITLNYNKIKRCLNFIKSTDNEKRYYIDNNKFIFVYDTKNDDNFKYIYGFSLNTAAFFGIPKKKIISLFENNPKNKKIPNFYCIPNGIKRLIKDEIPSKMILLEYFS